MVELFGVKAKVYSTNDANVYLEQLRALNMAELYRHGLEIAGVRPNADRNRMERLLIQAFNQYWINVNAAVNTPTVTEVPKDKAAKAKKIFSQW